MNDITGYAAGSTFDSYYNVGTILKTTDGGMSFVEETAGVRGQGLGVRVTARPNPFISYATIPGQEGKRLEMYDVLGRRVGVYPGDRVGWDLGPGVYFLRQEKGSGAPVRVVKIR